MAGLSTADVTLFGRQIVNGIEKNFVRPVVYGAVETGGCVKRKMNEMGKEGRKVWNNSFGDKPQTDADKAIQNSMKANLRHDEEAVNQIYKKQNKHDQQADAGWTEDTMTFSSEALALRA